MGEMNEFKIENGVLVNYSGKGGDVAIPDGVTKIGEYAFSQCEALASVTLPEGLTCIGREAFSSCTSLEKIDIPKGVTEIESNTFAGCEALASVTLPEGLTRIGWEAFSSCTSLEKIDIPDGVTKIADNAFKGCENLWSVTIPESVEDVGNDAFLNTYIVKNALKSSTFAIVGGVLLAVDKDKCEGYQFAVPDGVRVITGGVFEKCEKLQGVKLPDSVTAIGDEAFALCKNLEEAELPNRLEILGNRAFFWTAVKSVRIFPGIKTFGVSVFQDCHELEKVTICDGVTKIGAEVFKDCKKLRDVYIPKSLTHFGTRAFRGTPWLEERRVATQFEHSDGTIEYKNTYIIENGVLVDVYFYRNPLDIPAGVEKIANSACLYRIGNKSEKMALVEAIIPEGVTEIGSSAFSNNFYLKSIKLPSTLKKICSFAFYKDLCLTEDLVLPEGLCEIDDSAFDGCNFKSVKLPDSLTKIGMNAFRNTGKYINDIPKGNGKFEKKEYESTCPENPLDITYKGKTYTDMKELYDAVNGVTSDSK